MGYLVVEGGSLSFADGRRFAVGVHKVDKADEEAVKAAAEAKDGCYFTDSKPKGKATSPSFVDQQKQQFPHLGDTLTKQQKRQQQLAEKQAKKGDVLEESEQGDVDNVDPARTGERYEQGDTFEGKGHPDAIAEATAKN